MEEIAVSGCALKKDLMRVALKNIPDRPGIVAKIFTTIAQANIIIDDIIQNVLDDGTANISFTVEHGDIADLKPVMERLLAELGGAAGYEKDMAKVSVVGVGMKQATGVAATMFKALADQKINIQNISTSEIRISCLVSRADADHALRAVHSAFALDSERP